ncbi:26S proteasome non-ATPase regulatory subunit 10 [Brachionus plicatilis]|uniref:26S proteasome non-ATPase regulatory subunit 10 n=1 Tax=Brachionus plicatilis TaxID=10195 RepID=A0A3M7QXJ6_BRAPC|nr:26S proteasome non-ATPase regulatory subunit 10 [Brachionus plicatilis]
MTMTSLGSKTQPSHREEIFHSILTNNLDRLKQLVSSENVNIKDRSGYTLLHMATNNDKTEVAKWLVAAGADINIHCNTHTVLGTALTKANYDLFDFLLDNKAECIGRNQLNVLHEAANKNRLDIVVRLIEKGADPNLFNSMHITPLTIAIGHKNKPIVELLLENGACANLPDKKGNTSLHAACSLADQAIVACLLDNTECDLKLKNLNEETCLDLLFVSLIKENRLSFDLSLLLRLIQMGAVFSMPWNYVLNQTNYLCFLKLMAFVCKHFGGRLRQLFAAERPFFADLILTGYWKNSLLIAIKYAILGVQDQAKMDCLIKQHELLRLVDIILFSDEFNVDKRELLSTLYMFDDEADSVDPPVPNYLYIYLKKCFNKPFSLKNLCRNRIRASLPDLGESTVNRLKVKDAQLVDYLNFDTHKA